MTVELKPETERLVQEELIHSLDVSAQWFKERLLRGEGDGAGRSGLGAAKRIGNRSEPWPG
jgi:hypothetical protein